MILLEKFDYNKMKISMHQFTEFYSILLFILPLNVCVHIFCMLFMTYTLTCENTFYFPPYWLFVL